MKVGKVVEDGTTSVWMKMGQHELGHALPS